MQQKFRHAIRPTGQLLISQLVDTAQQSGPGVRPQQSRPEIRVEARALPTEQRGMVVQWSDYSPLTQENEVRFPAGVASILSHVGIVPDDAAGRQVLRNAFPSCAICAPIKKTRSHVTRRRDVPWEA
ncbi:hypothetical protein PR048_028191 [Dryococelus australis]|uniref:Uncharacterized protein n=1 Tax=Dryococelus australis TaxID=614101 RepID=A0ABQ9GIH7_9NEOP|nr:hypothetical protein PR048_028191 [Dryococelus australis]